MERYIRQLKTTTTQFLVDLSVDYSAPRHQKMRNEDAGDDLPGNLMILSQSLRRSRLNPCPRVTQALNLKQPRAAVPTSAAGSTAATCRVRPRHFGHSWFCSTNSLTNKVTSLGFSTKMFLKQ